MKIDDDFLLELGLLSGWKRISSFLGVSVWTARRYAKRYSMPIRNWPGGRPWAIPCELIKWGIYFDDAKKKDKKIKKCQRGGQIRPNKVK